MTDKMKALLKAIVKQHIDPDWDDDQEEMVHPMVWIPRELLEEAEALFVNVITKKEG